LWWFVGTGLGLGALSFLLQPAWLGAWLEQVRVYSTVVRLPGFQPLGLLLLLACWRLPWWARVAVAQVVFFPLYDPYLTLPLLFCWISIGGPLALAGASLSWIWTFGDLPNSQAALWGLMMLPLALAALRHSWHEPWWKAAGRESPVADR
ncbi:MAG TPA: hypothetical protein VFS21_05885, partial [Roseiflexaceae bacterium]|nr:hypothetical protein [Roseiflexaceae bacterium]